MIYSKKRINLLFSVTVVLISAAAIILSDDSSKLTDSFNDTVLSEIPYKSENTFGVYSTIAPVKTSASESESSLTIVENNDEVSSERYRVIKVVDGDTLDIDLNGKIERLRLIGIDTPETVDPRKDVQCFGKEASNKAKELLNEQYITLESEETQGERDKYKRLLRYVYLPDGTNFNLFMIAEGYAHEYTYDEPYKYQSEFKQAESIARQIPKGLWDLSVCLQQ